MSCYQIIECQQGSPEWHQARVGVITASMFADCRHKLKSGDYSAAAKKYAFRLAIERISGELLSEDKFETWEMRRGRELEPEARLAHEHAKSILVEQVGFVKTEDGLFGASADGFINEDRGAEYKAFVSPDSLMPILLDRDISDCMDQIQGGMWITGRKAWDFVLYCPALKKVGKHLTIFEVARDDDYIEQMEKDLWDFNRLVESYKLKLEAKS